MSDIRTTGLLDDFNRAPESPLSNGGKWSGINGSGLDTVTVGAGSEAHDPGGSGGGFGGVRGSYWNPVSFDGDCEIWAYPSNNASSAQQGWSLGIASAFAPYTGYLARWSEELGPNSIQISRWLNGSFTVLQDYRNFGNSVPVNNPNSIVLFRLVGNTLEYWWSNGTNGATWQQMTSNVDNTYRTGLRLCLILDGSPRWRGFGGGNAGTFIPQLARLNPPRKLWLP